MAKLGDKFDDWHRSQKELAKKVYVKDDAITINVIDEYVIALDRCQTSERLLGWVLHLTPKTWMSRDVLRRFILLAAGENDITIDYDG